MVQYLVYFSIYMLLYNTENHIEEKTQEIKAKDALIAAKEKTIKENSQNIAYLESELVSLRVSKYILLI